MFRIQPTYYTVKELARKIGVTPDAIHMSLFRTGAIAGVRIEAKRVRGRPILIPSDTVERIVAARF